MSKAEISSALQEINKSAGSICIMADPMTIYEVEMTDAFIAALDVDLWQGVFLDNIQNDTASAMLYFDLFCSDDETIFTRVAVLSNNTMLTQICTAEGFGKCCWYIHPSNLDLYSNLLSIISTDQ